MGLTIFEGGGFWFGFPCQAPLRRSPPRVRTQVLKEKLKAVYKRCAKHLDRELGLLPLVWRALGRHLEERWALLATRALACYDFVLDPTPEALRALCRDCCGDELESENAKPSA